MAGIKEKFNMPDWFDHQGFNKFYLSVAKAPNKDKLLGRFYDAWIEY